MIKSLFLIFLLFSQGFTKEYPTIFAQLANPLFSSSQNILKLSSIDSLNEICINYATHSSEVLEFAKDIDTSDKQATAIYLNKLRILQKEYDYTLFAINQTIKTSIDKDDYHKFLILVESDLDGILKGKALLNKAMKYYEKNRGQKKSQFLEEKLEFIKLLKTSEEEIYNQSIKDNFNSSSKKSKNQKVYIEAEETDKFIVMYITNKNYYPITMEINGRYKELNYDKKIKKVLVVKPRTKIEYIRLSKTRETYSYNLNYTWILGSKDAVHDDSYNYRLPYKKGTSAIVSQGYNGKHTHFGRNKYAIDFAMKIGTSIYAVRDGIVVSTKSNSNIGGRGREFSSHGNYIKILHNDGTFAIYYHLMMNGVDVKVKQKVVRGDKIGSSGNTGNSSGPHLHFSVSKAQNAKSTKSLAIKFISDSGIVNEPKRGTSYKAK